MSIKMNIDISAMDEENFKCIVGQFFDFLVDHIGSGIVAGCVKTSGATCKFRRESENSLPRLSPRAEEAIKTGKGIDTPSDKTEDLKVCEFCDYFQTNGFCFHSEAYGKSGWNPEKNFSCENWTPKLNTKSGDEIVNHPTGIYPSE